MEQKLPLKIFIIETDPDDVLLNTLSFEERKLPVSVTQLSSLDELPAAINPHISPFTLTPPPVLIFINALPLADFVYMMADIEELRRGIPKHPRCCMYRFRMGKRGGGWEHLGLDGFYRKALHTSKTGHPDPKSTPILCFGF